MLNLKSLKYKVIFATFLAGLFVFCFPAQTQAELNPQIFAKDLRIIEVKDNEIKGEFNIWNSENYYLSDLNYEIKLFQGTTFNKLELIDVVIPSETFFVAPNGTIAKSFAYQYPKNIITGDYTLRVRVITERGTELGWQDKVVSLQGENKFLQMFSPLSRVLVNGKESFALEGVSISPEENAVAFLKVKNPGNEITIVPNIKIFKRQINMPVFKEYQDSLITFAKGETKEIKLEMPKIDIPESYLAQVSFSKDNELVSGIQYFRWVVKGEGGKILYVKADKDYFKAGESVNLTIQSIGPADFSDIGTGKLEITIYDKEGNLVATTSQNVPLKSMLVSSIIAIPIRKDLISPGIDVKLTKDGRTLDERTINLPMFSDEAQQIEKDQIKEKELKELLNYLIPWIMLTVVLIIGFFVFKRRKR